MKYQCTVCGQIIDRNDVCPICGSDSSKIISLEEGDESVTFRCLSCGRIFEDKDVCPHCGGEELYDLTHECLFNRNKNKKNNPSSEESSETIDLSSDDSDDFDLLNEFSKSTQKPSNSDDEEVFEDKEIVLEKETPESEDDSTVIEEDTFSNAQIDVEEKDVEEEKEEVSEAVEEEPLKEEEPFVEEELEVEKEFKDDLLNEKEEKDDETSLDLKVKRLDLTKDLIIKLFLELESKEDESLKRFLKEELEVLNKLSSGFERKDIKSILDEKESINESIFEEEKDPFNGYVLYLEKSKKGIK